MKWNRFMGILLAFSGSPLLADGPPAESYFSGNHWSPYPPGCITVPLRQLDLYGDNVALFYDGTIDLSKANKPLDANPLLSLTAVPMKMYRIGCAEENRSVILVEFRLPVSTDDPSASQFEVPEFVDFFEDWGVRYTLNPEPNTDDQNLGQQVQSQRTFGDYTGGWSDLSHYSWRFILEFDVSGPGWTEIYNGRFSLGMKLKNLQQGYTYINQIDVPSTLAVLARNPDLPLNGRLSGNWMEGGTRDQGFLLSISSRSPAHSLQSQPENSELVVFLAWHTFDSNGEMLWLTASGSAPQGSTAVNLEFVRVNNGQFLGERRAERAIVGTGRLQARSCNQLELDYDLSELGLGQDSMELNRIFALEIAGYPCRDYAARVESLYGKESN